MHLVQIHNRSHDRFYQRSHYHVNLHFESRPAEAHRQMIPGEVNRVDINREVCHMIMFFNRLLTTGMYQCTFSSTCSCIMVFDILAIYFCNP